MGDTIVGYVIVIYDHDIPEFVIWHRMIDESKQRRGYGSATLNPGPKYIKTKAFGDSDRATLTYNKDNIQAMNLYKGKVSEMTKYSMR